MVSPKEILKGAVVSYEGKVQIVKSIGEYIMFEGWKEWVGPSLINGEPISEAWLERLGFVDDQHTYSRGRIWLAPGDKGFDVFTNGLSAGITTRIEYIHQLQCLYFVIIREHLIIPKFK